MFSVKGGKVEEEFSSVRFTDVVADGNYGFLCYKYSIALLRICLLSMPDYDFEHLDDKNFERMSTALCAEHIARGLRIYGSGTDGGREATFDGKTNYSAGGPLWDGY